MEAVKVFWSKLLVLRTRIPSGIYHQSGSVRRLTYTCTHTFYAYCYLPVWVSPASRRRRTVQYQTTRMHCIITNSLVSSYLDTQERNVKVDLFADSLCPIWKKRVWTWREPGAESKHCLFNLLREILLNLTEHNSQQIKRLAHIRFTEQFFFTWINVAVGMIPQLLWIQTLK